VRDVIVIGPPYISTEDEIAEIGDVLKQSIDAAIKRAG